MADRVVAVVAAEYKEVAVYMVVEVEPDKDCHKDSAVAGYQALLRVGCNSFAERKLVEAEPERVASPFPLRFAHR